MLACGLVGVYLAVAHSDAVAIRDGDRLGAKGEYSAAIARVRGVTRAPAVADALAIRAYALEGLHRYAAASREFAAAVRRAPNDWILEQDWAQWYAVHRDLADAQAHMRRALALNPRLTPPPWFTQSVTGGV